ncbi:M4 family metallopeptidase [Sporichthya sp.]|uniref:M4 family metallopeptidase n=1 Tax=Sporichthya sp. TaxID=65475 RepID=UPI0017A089EA|nr:M4 family metallopeptidase [Sporichthya sp.]MBA3742072.1 M4 family metallopeptidase [Sporichthya sp.]
MRAGPVMALAAVVAAAGIGVHAAQADPAVPTPATASPSAASWATQALLQDLTDAPLRITRDAYGLAHLLGTSTGHPLPLPAGVSPLTDVETQARAHLSRAAALFGLSDPARELRLEAEPVGLGNSLATDKLARFQQLRDGVPVLGGELVVVLDALGALKSVTGELSPAGTYPRPSVSAEQARATALAAVIRDHPDAHAPAIRAAQPELWHLDPALIGVPATRHMATGPVWRTEVSNAGEVRDMVLVDARTGAIPLKLNLIAHADRVVCDRKNQADKTDLGQDCKPAYARAEGQGPAGSPADVDQAFDFAGETLNFYASTVGVDLTQLLGVDTGSGDGKRLRSTVRFCPGNTLCSAAQGNLFDNAFWNGRGMYYGQGWTQANDIVAHEITHGVTEKTARLLYLYQSGAINESISDVFGELVDLANGSEDASNPWVIGEDAPLDQVPVRNMANPQNTLLPPLGQPDRMTAPNYDADLFFADNGGVHNNSGVNNKAAYLIATGGDFNGQSISGIGTTATAVLYYRVLRMLSSGADYADLGDVLRQGCANLVGQSGFTADTCAQVDKAVAATQMNAQPPGKAGAPEASVCPSGTTRVNLLTDGFEKFNKKTWGLGDQWTVIGDYAKTGTYSIYGVEPDRALSSPATLKSKITVPRGVGTFLRFAHQYRLDHGLLETGVVDRYYDGAVLEYRIGTGPWTNASDKKWENGPSRNIQPDPGGKYKAFGGDSKGYGSSKLDLGFLAGKKAEFRWRIVGDRAVAFDGWTVDDVAFYACGRGKPSDARGVKVSGKGSSATVKWSRPVYIPAGGLTGYSVTAKGAGGKVTKKVSAKGKSVKFTGLKSGAYTFTVTPKAKGGNGPGASVKRK